jgi:hypothetical protein
LRKDVGREAELRILFDVTTFTKAYVLVLLRYLDNLRLGNRITLFYTDIAGAQTGRPSEGIKRIIALPFYGGRYMSGKENVLFTFLASEPERVTALWEYVSPHITIPLYSIRRDGHDPLGSTILRKQFLHRPGVETPIQVSGDDPLAIAGTLSTLYAEYRDRYNVVFGAVGSKLQSVAMYLFSKLQSADFEVFYPIAARYNRDYWNPTEIGPAMKIEIFNGYRIERLEFRAELVKT